MDPVPQDDFIGGGAEVEEYVWVLLDNGFWNLEGPNFLGVYANPEACEAQVRKGLSSHYLSPSDDTIRFQVSPDLIVFVDPEYADQERWRYASPKWEARRLAVNTEAV